MLIRHRESKLVYFTPTLSLPRLNPNRRWLWVGHGNEETPPNIQAVRASPDTRVKAGACARIRARDGARARVTELGLGLLD